MHFRRLCESLLVESVVPQPSNNLVAVSILVHDPLLILTRPVQVDLPSLISPH